MQVRAAIVSELNGPWHTETIEIDEPHASEVKVKMAFAGMCHSDEHIRTGDMVPGDAIVQALTGRDSIYPVIGGHEGAGVVESVGENVTTLKPGDHVAVSFIPSCGRCESCASGRQYLCDLGAHTLMGPMISDGTWRHHLGDVSLNRVCQLGTFSEYIVVHEASLIRIDPWYDLRAAALISCGISTGFGSAVTRGGTKPGDTVAVIGCGGVGSGAIQGAVHAGARAVIAIDTNRVQGRPGAQDRRDARLRDDARRGVQHPSRAHEWEELRRHDHHRRRATGELIEQARSITAKGGVVVTIAIAPYDLDDGRSQSVHVLDAEPRSSGSIFGSDNPRVQVPKLLRLHHEGKLHVDDLITEEYTVENVQQGYDDLASGKNVRGVVRF